MNDPDSKITLTVTDPQIIAFLSLAKQAEYNEAIRELLNGVSMTIRVKEE